MATETKQPGSNLGPGRNPGDDEFAEIIEKNFSPGDEAAMKERAKKGADSKDPLSPEELANSESSAAESGASPYGIADTAEPNADDRVGRGYKKSKPQISFIRKQLGTRNRAFLIGGSSLGLIAVALIFLFLALLPFKLLHIVNNLQSRFYATSENAVGNESNALFSDYLRKYVMPSLRSCNGKVDASCNPIHGGGLVSQLYKGWRNAKIEDKLATQYGLKFQYSPSSHHFYLKSPNTTGEGVDLGSDSDPNGFFKSTGSLDDFISKSNDPEFKVVSRSELRAAINDSLGKETSWKNVMYRYKVGRFMESKYGLKRCIIACDTRDNFSDWKDNKARAAKMIIAERVLAPRSETLALVIQCVLSGTCGQTSTDADGRKQSDIQVKVQQKLDALAAQDTGKYADVLAHSNNILNNGYKKYVVKQIINAIAGKEGAPAISDEAASKISDELLPVIGWVNAASSTIGELQNAPEQIKAASYITNAAAMVSLYTTYRTFADETKSGHVDPTIVGSFSDSLGSGDKEAAGGIATAEQTPLYNYIMNGGSGSAAATSAFDNLFNGNAYAASPASSYVCSNGKPVPAGQLVCQEEVLGGANSAVVDTLNNINKSLGPLVSLAYYWNHTIGHALKAIVNELTTYIVSPILKRLPGYGALVNVVSSATQPLISAFTDYLIPSPFSDDMGGGRNFDMLAGGADVSGNDYAQNGLGGEKLSNEQVSTILDVQNQQQLQSYQGQSFFARMFDTNSNYSPATKLAMAMPDSSSALSSSVASFFSDPLGKLFGGFASIFGVGHANAATINVQNDPFGVTQYGYPVNDPTLTAANQDPETYWENNCTTDGTTIDWTKPVNANWQNSATTNSDTGQPENDSTDPCLLIQAAVGSAGAVFTSSVLTMDDLGSSQAPTSSATSPSTTAGSTLDMSTLYDDSTSVACAPGTRDLGASSIQDGYYNGNKVEIRICAIPNLPSSGQESNGGFGVVGANGQAVVNSRVSGAVLAMVQAADNAGVKLTAISSFRTMAHQETLCPCDGITVAHPGYSNHQMGLAIDFGGGLPSTPGPVPGNAFWNWLVSNAGTFGYKNYPNEAWHWSPTGN